MTFKTAKEASTAAAILTVSGVFFATLIWSAVRMAEVYDWAAIFAGF